ncbi:MAG: molybdenum cofactor guanylyltransferase, partial [Anaerolineaceae bacterium]|nr:molybdenum cofactor guanylyltransferase [Anaerolineaceae bacterium]
MPGLTIALEAGGDSRRMGSNKALLPFLGKPLIQRLAERFSPIADELIVITNHLGDLAPLGLRLVADIAPGSGALGGLLSALAAARQPLVGVVACDMPFASPELLAAARDLLVESGVDVVI